MNFIETEEQTLLRQEVRAIAKPFGREYYLKKARAGSRSTSSGPPSAPRATWA
jgi:hypothetical protein